MISQSAFANADTSFPISALFLSDFSRLPLDLKSSNSHIYDGFLYPNHYFSPGKGFCRPQMRAGQNTFTCGTYRHRFIYLNDSRSNNLALKFAFCWGRPYHQHPPTMEFYLIMRFSPELGHAPLMNCVISVNYIDCHCESRLGSSGSLISTVE